MLITKEVIVASNGGTIRDSEDEFDSTRGGSTSTLEDKYDSLSG